MEIFHNKECLNPPCARRPAFPDDVQRIALLCCSPINKQTKQQTPEKKNGSYVLWVSEQSFPEGSSQRRIPDACRRVEKKIRRREAKNGQRGTSPGADNFDSASRRIHGYETRRRVSR